MTRNTLKALAAVALLMAATVTAHAYTGWQVGTWERTAHIDDQQVRVRLEIKADTIHGTIRGHKGLAAVTMTVDADYLIARDGTVVGIVAPGKTKDKAKDALKDRVFTCRISPEKNSLVVSEVNCGDDSGHAKQVLEGKYHKVEAKASHVPTPTYAPPAPPPPPQAPPTTPPPALDNRTSVRFVEPVGMKVSWMVPSKDGKRDWSDKPLEAPATYSFRQGAIYRLKLTNIAGHSGLELFPTLEIVPDNKKSAEYLAHNSLPVEFTADDLRGSKSGYVVKVIYLPSADALPGEVGSAGGESPWQVIKLRGGLGEIVSTDASADPIKEATRRGTILAVVRLGNIDLEKTPALESPFLPASRP